jgi:hypothetical protein
MTVIRRASALPGKTEWLARESAGKEVKSDFLTSSASTFPPVPGLRLPGFPLRGVGHRSGGDVSDVPKVWVAGQCFLRIWFA